jgi:dTMP kinase
MAAQRGRFLVIDGVDGCGKTTQAARLCAALVAAGRPDPLHLREPGSTALGERLRAILLGRELALSPGVQALLFAAARRQMLEELVEPALAAGRDVVCERFHPSTFAYQAVAGGLDEDLVLELLTTWAGAPEPDLVVVIAVDPAVAELRRRERAGSADRYEGAGLEFQREAARGLARYVERARRLDRVVAVDGDRDPDEVARAILAEVQRAL